MAVLKHTLVDEATRLWMSRRRTWMMRVAAVFMGLMAATGIAELTLRIVGIGFPNFYAPDEFCGARLRSSTCGVWTQEGHGNVSIDSLGFRGSEMNVTRSSNVCRIAVIGDSFIEALQVNDSATFCAQLQSLLNDRDPADPMQYEVVNCGVSGYGTAQELLMLRHYLLPLQPDAVLVAVYPENDIRNNSRLLEGDPGRPYFRMSSAGELDPDPDNSFRTDVSWRAASTRYEQIKAAVINRSRLLQVVQAAKRRRKAESGQTLSSEETLVSAVNQARYVYGPSEIPAHQQAWQLTELLMKRMADECTMNAISLFFMDVPSSVQSWPHQDMWQRVASTCQVDDFFYAEKRLQAICQQAAVPFFPLASKMHQEAERRGEFLHGFHNTVEGVGHWNASGNSVAAELVVQWLWPQLAQQFRTRSTATARL
jgi:lysophospholipase L1-like esterase